jgi:multiple antibiotic resistance protein
VVVDPFGVAPIFAGLTSEDSAAERRRLAVRGVAIGSGVLVVFALGGQALLDALGITLPAFRIAGGLLLLLLSIDMVMARQSGLRAATPGEVEESSHRADISVFPLGIPLIAGPGALTSVVLTMGRAEGDLVMQTLVIAVLVAVLAITLICLLAAAQLMRLLGVTGMNVISRVSGMVVAALAVQFMIDGVLAVLPA